ncbi:MAG TPA: glycoside hydrolase family 19 protein [Methylobacter sp.]|jgi:putative chitinase
MLLGDWIPKLLIDPQQPDSDMPFGADASGQQTVMPTAMTSATQVDMPSMVAVPTPDVTAEQIMQIMPNARVEDVQRLLPHINAAMQKYDINTAPRESAFLAQVSQETGDLRYLHELGSGSKYDGRVDLGNTQPGDGARFKGGGLMQITGRNNYGRMGKALGVDLINHPELLQTPQLAANSAAQYFQSRGLNYLADNGRFNALTKGVNGASNAPQTNLNRRQQAYIRGMNVLGY